MTLTFYSLYRKASKKQQFKKKKKKTSAASSSRPPRVELLSDAPSAKERKQKLQKLQILNHHYLDFRLLEEYGLMDPLMEIITDDAWLSLFSIKEPAYKDLTIEFLSTLSITSPNQIPTMQFQAYGEVKTIELKRIGHVLGLYDSPEANQDLPNSWPDHMNASKYWLHLIHPRTDPFVPSKSLSSSLAATEYKLFHHMLSHSISGKKMSHSKVTSFDIFYLFSMITGYRIDLGVEIANYMDRQAQDTRTKAILCGGYITALLKGMGIFQLPARDQGIECKKISSAPFRLWGIDRIPDELPADADTGAPEIAPAAKASTSHTPPVSEYEKLRQDIQELKEVNKKERKKNKKFRISLVSMIKSATSCIDPVAGEAIHYETSEEEASSPEH